VKYAYGPSSTQLGNCTLRVDYAAPTSHTYDTYPTPEHSLSSICCCNATGRWVSCFLTHPLLTKLPKVVLTDIH
jgi:hypothetical protein